MNRERLQAVRDYIADELHGFCYQSWFKEAETKYYATNTYKALDSMNFETKPSCGTIGCVAGTAVLMFWDELPQTVKAIDEDEILYEPAMMSKNISLIAKKILDLTKDEGYFLFVQQIALAGRQEALDRIDWLLVGNRPQDYSFRDENKRRVAREVKEFETGKNAIHKSEQE